MNHLEIFKLIGITREKTSIFDTNFSFFNWDDNCEKAKDSMIEWIDNVDKGKDLGTGNDNVLTITAGTGHCPAPHVHRLACGAG